MLITTHTNLGRTYGTGTYHKLMALSSNQSLEEGLGFWCWMMPVTWMLANSTYDSQAHVRTS
jgi:hypothetical protein